MPESRAIIRSATCTGCVAVILLLVLSICFPRLTSACAAAILGTAMGAINFVSLHRFGIRILCLAEDDDPGPTGTGASQARVRPTVVVNTASRMVIVVLGLAVAAKAFGLVGLVTAAVLFFAVQVSLFLRLARYG